MGLERLGLKKTNHASLVSKITSECSLDFRNLVESFQFFLKKRAFGNLFATTTGMNLLKSLAFLLILSSMAQALEKTPIILSPGETALLNSPSNQTLKIGDKSLVRIQTLGNKISLLAIKQGQTQLLIDSQNYRIFILDSSLKSKALALEKLLKTLKGLKWTLQPTENSANEGDSKFIIHGELYRFSDWLSLQKISQKHSINYEFKAVMDEELKKISHYYFNQKFQKNFHSQALTLDFEDLPFVAVPSGSPLTHYEKTLSSFGLKLKERENWFFKAPLLEIEFAVVESLSSSGFFAGGVLDKNLSGFSSLLSFLNFLRSSGKGKSLHHSSLLAQSGKSIDLESGGQIPISTFHLKSEQQSTNWKSHGLKINLKATAGVKGLVFLKIKARLSEPLALSSNNATPPLKNQNLETEMVLEEGQLFKLFELKKQSQGRFYQGGLSFLRFNLFNSSQNKQGVNQYVFIRISLLNNGQDKENLSDRKESDEGEVKDGSP